MNMNRVLAVLLAVAMAGCASPDHKPETVRHPTQSHTLEGKVTRIIDGDTLIVTDFSRVVHEVRLRAIDTPERGEPFFQQSTDALTALALDEDVLVKWKKYAGWGRIEGDVYVAGEWINFRMIAQGWATHVPKYNHDPQLANIELFARQNQLGLWTNVPPPADVPTVIDTTNVLKLEVFSPAK